MTPAPPHTQQDYSGPGWRGPLQDRRGVGLPSLGAWWSALDPCLWNSRALLSKVSPVNPPGGAVPVKAFLPQEPAPQGPWREGSLAWILGGRGAALEEGELVLSLPAPTSPGSPLPAPALASSGTQATIRGRASGGPPRPSAVMATQSSRPLQARLGGLSPGGPPWVPTSGERPGLEEEVPTDAETEPRCSL